MIKCQYITLASMLTFVALGTSSVLPVEHKFEEDAFEDKHSDDQMFQKEQFDDSLVTQRYEANELPDESLQSQFLDTEDVNGLDTEHSEQEYDKTEETAENPDNDDQDDDSQEENLLREGGNGLNSEVPNIDADGGISDDLQKETVKNDKDLDDLFEKDDISNIGAEEEKEIDNEVYKQPDEDTVHFVDKDDDFAGNENDYMKFLYQILESTEKDDEDEDEEKGDEENVAANDTDFTKFMHEVLKLIPPHDSDFDNYDEKEDDDKVEDDNDKWEEEEEIDDGDHDFPNNGKHLDRYKIILLKKINRNLKELLSFVKFGSSSEEAPVHEHGNTKVAGTKHNRPITITISKHNM